MALEQPLRVRWLGRVRYQEAWALQRALHDHSSGRHLLLLEHPHVFTLGVRGDSAHILVDPESVGAEVVRSDRGGDVTYHGPGQLVGYPIVDVPTGPSSMPCHVHAVEQVVIDALAQLGLPVGRLAGYPGIWVDTDGSSPRKIGAVGVRVTRQRSMHGFALNVDPDLKWFGRIVPCGIGDKAVTSMAAEGVDATMEQVVEAITASARVQWGGDAGLECQQIPSRGQADARNSEREAGSTLRLRLRQAGVSPEAGLHFTSRKPPWVRVPAHMGEDFHSLRRTVRDLGLVTVCEEAGCPNIFECWADGTATFMINGERCTRACGFCLVDTRRPGPLDPDEPGRVAAAVQRLGLAHAVVTAVARDDLADGGANAFARTISEIRSRCPGTRIEVLVPDCKGDESALNVLFGAGPDVFNHNLETVLRLQRAVRPSAGYARSLSVLARAKTAGLVTKSGLILGMGEEEHEVVGALADLRGVGVDIVTLGQYLRPTRAHLPVARWWEPSEFERLAQVGHAMGFAHVQASPLTRSSYHARAAAESARGEPVELVISATAS